MKKGSLAELKSAVGMVRDIWDAAATLGSLKGLLFDCSLGAFIDAGLAHLRMGNLMSIDWHTPPLGPDPLLWGLAAFIAMPLLVAPFIQGFLGVTFGHQLWRLWHWQDIDSPRYGELIPDQLMELALFENDTQLEAYVRSFTARWSGADEEGDKLMRESWACTLSVSRRNLAPSKPLYRAAAWPPDFED
jgi:hypothetical protein